MICTLYDWIRFDCRMVWHGCATVYISYHQLLLCEGEILGRYREQQLEYRFVLSDWMERALGEQDGSCWHTGWLDESVRYEVERIFTNGKRLHEGECNAAWIFGKIKQFSISIWLSLIWFRFDWRILKLNYLF